MPRTKNCARRGGGAATGNGLTKRQAAAVGISKKRARAPDSDGGGGGGRSKKKKPRTEDPSFLTEEENLATYYPLPPQLRPPPSPAFLSHLHDELLSYSDTHVASPAMTSARWAIIHGVRDAARELFGPEVETVPFGSFVTGLYIGSSDIDLVLLNVQCSKAQVAGNLTKLGVRLRKLGLAKDLDLIPNARVPLLKYTSVDSDIPVDISLGVVDGVLSANLMKKQVDAFPAFKPLTLVLKAFMQAMGLADVFRGGISSYILQVMILFHLQVQDTLHQRPAATTAAAAPSTAAASSSPPFVPSGSISPDALPTSNLGYLLYTFFELFGCTFNYEEHGIRIWDLKKTSQLECYAKSALGRLDRNRPWLLSIEDPIQKERDIGGACFGIRRVQRCFALAREFLCSEPAAARHLARNAKQHQEPTTIPSYISDTTGDAATSATTQTAAADPTSALAPVAAAAAAAAASSPAPPSVDPSSTSFGSSFGFILSSLLSLPVRYSVGELRVAGQKQPAWLAIVEKMATLEAKLEKKRRKAERNARKSVQRHKAEVKAAKELKRAKRTAVKAANKANKASKAKASSAASGTPAAASGVRSGTEATTGGEESATSDDDADGEEEEEDEDDSDVEIVDQDGSRVKPIPIDDMTDGDEDDQPMHVTEGDEAEPPMALEGAGGADAAEVAAAAAENLAGDSTLPIDGDAMLAADHEDENMELNLRREL